MSVIVLQVVSSAQSLREHKTILSIVDIGAVVYLSYFNSWMRNKIITWAAAWQNRLE